MNKRTLIVCICLTAIVLTTSAGCRGKNKGVAQEKVSEYVRYFGELNPGFKKDVSPFVIFVPSRMDKAKTVPMVVMVISGADKAKSLTQAVVMGFTTAEASPKVASASLSSGKAKISMSDSKIITDTRFMPALARTLAQIDPEISDITIADGDKKISYSGNGTELEISDPGNPVLMQIFKVNRTSPSSVEEYGFYFDRPVKVKAIKAFDSKGREVEIEYLETVFDLMTVVRFIDPSIVKPGLELDIKWEAVDSRGRLGNGERSWHP